jgi:hypothetical protein
MRQRWPNHQMAMPQVYPGTVEGVAEAIEVETVAARLMMWPSPRDFDSEVRNGRYCWRALSPAEAATAAKLPNYRLKVTVYEAGRKTMPNGLSGSRSASRLEWGTPMVSVCRGFAGGLLLTAMAGVLFSACAGEATRPVGSHSRADGGVAASQ